MPNGFSRRRFLQVSGIAAGTAAFGFPAVHAAEPLKVGVVQPFSGGLELFGNQAKLGLDLAAKEINAAGGILGRQLELVYEDSKTDPKTAVERTQKLIQRDRVVAISGPISSAERDAMTPAATRGKTPLLYATNYEGGACGRYLFSFNMVPNQDLAKLLPYMAANFGNSYYLFGADYVWPQKMFQAAKATIAQANGTTSGEEYTPWGVKEFAPVVRRIADSGAKVLVFALPGADGITFVKQAEDLGLLKSVTVAFLGFTETYLGAFGAGKGQGMFATAPFVMSLQEPAAQDFVKRVQAAAGKEVTVSHYVMTHYNSLMALKLGLEKRGEPTAEAAVDGMAGLEFATPTGTASIGAADHHVAQPLYLAKTVGDGLEVIEAFGAIPPAAGCA